MPYTDVIFRYIDDGLQLPNGEREIGEILGGREWTYRGLEEGVRTRLVNLAIIARKSMESVWPRQLDKSKGCG